MAENTSDDDFLREEGISVEDNLEGMATGSKSSTVSSENAELKALLTSMNETMKAMSESLRGSGDKPTPKPAESAKRGRKTNNGSHESLSDSAESDAEQLLEPNKRQKIQDGDEEEDTLLDEIVQSMTETEKTDAKISEKLAKIIENRWLNKLSDGQFKGKTEKYLRPANCDNFITPKVNPEIWERLDRQTRVFKAARFQLPRFALHKYWQAFFRENLSDEPAEQPRSEQPELPPKEKRSQRSEVTTTGIISQLDSPQEDQDTLSTSTASGNTSTSHEARTSCLPLVGDLLSDQGISKEASELILKSWRTGTQKQYRTYLERWKVFCTSREVNPLCGTVTNGIDFLVTQYKRGLTYSSLNTARCALSTVILLPNGITFGNHPLVTRLMKGVFESRPTLPRYNSIWNVSTVLDFIKTLGPNEELSLKNVTLKCVTLVALLSGQRCQTIHALRISGMKETNGQIRFDIFTLLKTSKPGKHQEPLTFKPYTYDSQLCVVKCLQEYIKQTSEFRNGADQLWLSYQKPHNPASKDTVSRWIKEFLKKSGIDVSSYGAHSTRAASSSAASSSPTISLQTIMNAAGWARESTFRKFYDKPADSESPNFGEQLLLHCNEKQ
ncbi:uncharacterized protein [Montipora capricornis]|uniref:uncharacterized protein n=1 Tax=Montipora capricornis TaxID=246305 RepID=UPI0035F1252A